MNCLVLYRNHDTPEAEKAARVSDFVKHFGLSFPEETRHRQIISVSLKRHASALMRLVSIACYCAPCSKPTMHRPISDTLGWRMRAYSHFTSPIRRYPDLMLHRAIKAKVTGKKAAARLVAGEMQVNKPQ